MSSRMSVGFLYLAKATGKRLVGCYSQEDPPMYLLLVLCFPVCASVHIGTLRRTQKHLDFNREENRL